MKDLEQKAYAYHVCDAECRKIVKAKEAMGEAFAGEIAITMQTNDASEEVLIEGELVLEMLDAAMKIANETLTECEADLRDHFKT